MTFAAESGDIRASFHLTPSELEIDEGDVVEFFLKDKEYLHPTSGEPLQFEADLSPVAWDFNDPLSDPAEDYGLYHIRQWFSDDDKGEPRVVKATHQGTTEEIEIRVRNVLPRVNGVYMTKEPRSGKPTVFQAIARDPGFSDELSFEWSFGDGATAKGPNVIHTYARGGDYPVTLRVADEEGREDESAVQSGTFTVKVKDGRDVPDENTLSVTGDISESKASITGVSIVGSNGNVMNPKAGGACQVRLEMRTDRDDMLLTLTARLQRGLAPGHYQIGRTREWDGMHRDDQRAAGTFFADFSPPRDQANIDHNGLTVGGPFWSDGGHLTITRFDSGVLELDFETSLIEEIPAEYQPRQVRVRGMLSTTIGKPPKLGDVRNPSDMGKAADGMFGSGEQGDFNLKAYLCPGEEPAEFALVETAPAANATGALYENAGVSLRFSQVVDSDSVINPDTLSANLELLFRNSDGTYYSPRGGWVALPDNPTVVQFIPQSRLLPGTVYCVFVKGGEDGLRSFGGNLLGASSLAAPSAKMAPACRKPDRDEFGFTFSTRVELQSVWTDLYQASLAGPRAELLPAERVTARVYAWWRDARHYIHPTAQVREFPADVSVFANGVLMETACNGRCDYTRSVTIKRPDLYTSAQRRNQAHTAGFSTFINQDMEVSAVIQMKDGDGRLLEPVFTEPSTRYSLRKGNNQGLVFGQIQVKGACATGVTQQPCIWGGPWDESWTHTAARSFEQIEQFAEGQLPVNFIDLGYGAIQQADGTKTDIEALAGQIVRQFLDSDKYDRRVSVLLALVPPGLFPGTDVAPSLLVNYEFPTPPVIVVQVDRFNPVAVTALMVWALLDDDACLFEGDSFCDATPVQGMRNGYNKHHVEGNGESDRLVPLMQPVPWDDHNERDFHISAYNWGKLYEAFKRRDEFAKGASPGS